MKTNLPLSEVKPSVGRWMMRAAWMVEIAAVIVGLSIAASIAWSTGDQIKIANSGSIPTSKLIDIVIAALPLAIVAIVELCRIPLALASYHVAGKRWRILFLTMLFLLIALNFETLSQGFMRQYQNLTYSVEKKYDELQVVNEKLYSENERYDELIALSPREIKESHYKNISDIHALYLKELESIDSDIQDPNFGPRIEQIDLELKSLEKEKREAIEDQRQTDNDQQTSANKRLNQKFDSLSKTLESAKSDLKNLNDREQTELAAGNVFTKAAIRQRYAKNRVVLQDRINDLTNKLSQINIEPPTRSDDKISEITQLYNKKLAEKRAERSEIVANSVSEDKKKELEAARKEAKDKYDSARELEEGNYQRELDQVTQRNELLANIEKQRVELTKQRTSLREAVTLEARSSPIHSLARLISGEKTAADIPPELVRNVAVIWFSSIALVVSVTGTVLAFAGQVLIHTKEKKERLRSKLVKSIRRLLVRLGRRRRHYKIKEVVKIEEKIKEVEKIIEKEVEKPVEVFVTKEVEKLVEVPVHHVKYKYLPVPGWGVTGEVKEEETTSSSTGVLNPEVASQKKSSNPEVTKSHKDSWEKIWETPRD
ncbi:inner membrane complex domain-containing protein [Arenicellales bacterium IMCC56312]